MTPLPDDTFNLIMRWEGYRANWLEAKVTNDEWRELTREVSRQMQAERDDDKLEAELSRAGVV